VRYSGVQIHRRRYKSTDVFKAAESGRLRDGLFVVLSSRQMNSRNTVLVGGAVVASGAAYLLYRQFSKVRIRTR
jgi:hypothetical protein